MGGLAECHACKLTGYPYERVSVQWRNVLSQLDVLITDPYRPEAGTSLVLRGSDNQRIFLLTELARERYPSDLDRQAWPEERRMDVFLERDKIWMAGIPRSDEMERLKKLLAVQGLTCQTSEEIRAQLLP